MPSILAPAESTNVLPALVDVRNLTVRFGEAPTRRTAVEEVSFTIGRGETVAILGESGSGKTQILLSIIGLLSGAAVASGSIRFDGTEILAAGERHRSRLRGDAIAMIFQDPMNALNPFLRISTQLVEGMVRHRDMDASNAATEAVWMLDQLGLSDADLRIRQYPHELSGGIRQRILIAMALLCGPVLLLADEPTTALDVTLQARALDLLRERAHAVNMTMLLVTHDLGVAAATSQRVIVLNRGRVVEEGPTDTVFTSPRHSYTQGLLAAFPRLETPTTTRQVTPSARSLSIGPSRAQAGPVPSAPHEHGATNGAEAALVRTEDLHVHFASRRRPGSDKRALVRALDGVTLEIAAGETLAVVGESGCGKSTLCRAVVGLIAPTGGRVRWRGVDLNTLKGERLRQERRHVQMIFQDAAASLDPRMTVRGILQRQLLAFSAASGSGERTERLISTLELVHGDEAWLDRFPHELSGGECQRVAIARALLLQPGLIVCDEPLSSLDSNVQTQIMNLLLELQSRLRLGYLFVSHNMAAVQRISHRVIVMYIGRIVEIADREDFFRRPLHPYSRALLDAVLSPDTRAERARTHELSTAKTSSWSEKQGGCRFRDRCPVAMPVCAVLDPALKDQGEAHFVACHYVDQS